MNDEIPSEIKTACPHCGQHLAIDGSMLGTELECPTCKQPFSVSVPMTGNETESKETASPVGMEDGTVEPACEELAKSDMTPPTGTSAPPPLPPPPPSTPKSAAPSVAPAMSKASRDMARDFANGAHGSHKRGKRIALLAGVPLLACVFFLFGRGCFQEDIIPDGTLKVAISDSEIQQAEDQRNRDKEFADSQRARGLVLIGGEWMTPGSARNAVLTVMQKLQIEGWTMRRAPQSGEHGGLLCLDSVNEVGCIIVSAVEWDNAQEGCRCRFDRLYRCGNFSYPTKAGEQKTVRLYATDLDTALEELNDQRYSRQF